MSKNIFIICMVMALSFLGCAKQHPLKTADDAVVHSEQNEETLKADSSDVASCENDSCDFEDCLSSVWPPIHCYVTEEMAKEIVSQKVDVNALNANEETPLMFAKDAQTAKILIDAGADLNGKANGRTKDQMMTPLSFAINLGKSDVARTLIEAGADLNATDDMNRTPLINSLENENIEIAKLLIASGADVNKPSKYGEIALNEAIRLNYTEISQMLIKSGADVNAMDQFDRTPLMAAATVGNIEIFRMLLEAGAKFDAKNNDYLLEATKGGNIEIVKYMLENGADDHATDEFNRTPLALRKNMLEESGQSVDSIENDEIIILLKSHAVE